MYNLLTIYDCSVCGKVLSDEIEIGSDFDTERDEEYTHIYCKKCNGRGYVEQRLTKNPETGQIMNHYEEVDEERARWANGFYDDEDKEIDYFDGDY